MRVRTFPAQPAAGVAGATTHLDGDRPVAAPRRIAGGVVDRRSRFGAARLATTRGPWPSQGNGRPRSRLAFAAHATVPWLVLLVVVALALSCAPPASAAGLLVADGGLGGVLAIERSRSPGHHQQRHRRHRGRRRSSATPSSASSRRSTPSRCRAAPRSSDFAMWINGKEMVGEVVEKQRAREIYESYKQQQRDPGLLEQTDYKTFEMRIFPIAARRGAAGAHRLLPGAATSTPTGRRRSTRSPPPPAPVSTRARTGRSRSTSRCARRCRSSPWRAPATRRTSSSRSTAPTIVQAQPRAERGRPAARRGGELPHRAGAHRPRSRGVARRPRGRLLPAHPDRRRGAAEARSTPWTTSSCSTSRAAWTTTASWRCRATRWAPSCAR